jgi:hypothetical protein
MADRKLTLLFAEAAKPLSELEADSFVCAARDKWGELPAYYFGLPVYKNPVGIEVEVEGYGGLTKPPLYWHTIDDGSLKDNGAELISIPLRGRNIDYALHEFSSFGKAGWKFSHRTSVHVHCNVSTYTKYQLRALMAIYACMEELYFAFVEDFRRGNSFCYRLVGAPVEMVFYMTDKEGSECTKYCAFNIQPVRRQLTVEFRHLEGTSDLTKLRRWIQLCAKLVGFVAALEPKECTEIVSTALMKRGMVALIKDILGDTGDAIFTDRQIAESVNNGELWAMALLTKEP